MIFWTTFSASRQKIVCVHLISTYMNQYVKHVQRAQQTRISRIPAQPEAIKTALGARAMRVILVTGKHALLAPHTVQAKMQRLFVTAQEAAPMIWFVSAKLDTMEILIIVQGAVIRMQ